MIASKTRTKDGTEARRPRWGKVKMTRVRETVRYWAGSAKTSFSPGARYWLGFCDSRWARREDGTRNTKDHKEDEASAAKTADPRRRKRIRVFARALDQLPAIEPARRLLDFSSEFRCGYLPTARRQRETSPPTEDRAERECIGRQRRTRDRSDDVERGGEERITRPRGIGNPWPVASSIKVFRQHRVKDSTREIVVRMLVWEFFFFIFLLLFLGREEAAILCMRVGRSCRDLPRIWGFTWI